MLDSMQDFDIDTERLPLGNLSRDQVQRGYNVLERLRSALNGAQESLERLSSEFYQVALPVPQCCMLPGQALLQSCVSRTADTLHDQRHLLQHTQPLTL